MVNENDSVSRVCSKCKEEKLLEDFPIESNKRGGRGPACRVCFNIRRRKWAKTSSGRDAYDYQTRRIFENKKKAVAYLGGICVDCSGEFDAIVYDFHHLNPSEKERTISSIRASSWDKIKVELDKCILLCANCHRLRHNAYKELE